MPQAARRIVPALDQPAPRPRLRVVPPPRPRPPRRPPPEVIRRRRAVALGALAGMVGLPLAIVSLGGGSDAQRITAMLERGAAAPATLCDDLSSGMLRAIGGHDACVATSPERGPSGEVTGVRISGDRAVAIVTRPGDADRVRLVREDGAWKVDDVR